MKAVRIILITAMIIFAVTGSFAQSKTTFGIRGGLNLYNINGRDGNDDKLDNKLKAGFNIGANAEIPIGIDFYVQPGVIFSKKGADETFGSQNKISISYIEIPINLLYKPAMGEGRLVMGFGPYIAFGAGGTYKLSNGNKRDIKFESPITLAQAASADLYLKGFDAGANLLFGYEFSNKISIQLNAGLGLVNINPEIENISGDKSAWKNTGFGVSAGYRF